MARYSIVGCVPGAKAQRSPEAIGPCGIRLIEALVDLWREAGWGHAKRLPATRKDGEVQGDGNENVVAVIGVAALEVVAVRVHQTDPG